MTIALQPLDQLDIDKVTQNLAELVTRVQEENDTIEVRRGVFRELVLYFQSVLATQRQVNIDDYLNSRSLQVMQDNPTLASEEAVDDVLSNFRVTRAPGTLAIGSVTIVLNNDITVTLALGANFQANGKRFVTPQVYTAKTEESQVIASGDRLLRALGNGNFAFDIEVEAVEEGEDSRLTKDTVIVPNVLPPGYVTSYAASDFVGGKNPETNEVLLNKLQQGIAAKALSNRVNMAAALRDIEEFSRIIHMSIIGYGDAEMLRDRHWIFPVSGGGRVDWYIRSEEKAVHTRLLKTATLVEKTLDGYGIWQVGIGRDEVPGFYEIDRIMPVSTTDVLGGFTITDDVRSLDLAPVTTADSYNVPDVANLTEGAYSRFQAAVIRFKDTKTLTANLDLGSTSDYEMEAIGVPLIAEVQDYVSSRNISHYGADALVRAPIPCFVQLSFTINKPTTVDTPDLDAIKNALTQAVNQVDFTGQLHASSLFDVIHGFLSGGASVGSIDLFGRLRYPSGTIRYLRSPDVLIAPEDPANTVTRRTVQFFLAPEDIAITVAAVAPSAGL